MKTGVVSGSKIHAEQKPCTNHYTCIAPEHNETCPALLNKMTGEWASEMPADGDC